MLSILAAMDLSSSVINALPAVAPVAEQDTPLWVKILVSVISAAFSLVLLPYLKSKADTARHEASSAKTEDTFSKISLREAIFSQMKAYVLTLAESMAEKEFPKLADRVSKGELKSVEEIKDVLKSWGVAVKSETILYFKEQGVDIVELYGETAIDAAIEWAANKVSPFPGMPTAKAMLADGANLLLAKGVTKLKNYYETK